MIHYIYCYTNKKNNKQYIGQTNNIERRKKQHLQDSIHCHQGHEVSYNSPFHSAVRKYGIDSFNFEILEIIETNNWDEVNELETKYIKEKNSLSPNGYNLKAQGEANRGLNISKLPIEQILSIVSDLKNGVEIKTIAEKNNLSRSYISDINNGRCCKIEGVKYPVQQNRISEEEYLDIIDMIKNTNYSLRKIAEYFNRSRDTIEKINKGNQAIVRVLYDEDFPIRRNARKGYTLKPVETIQGET